MSEHSAGSVVGGCLVSDSDIEAPQVTPIAEYVPVSKSRLPRWMHRIYAAVAGYFWLPCPRCGRGFGGHEPHGKSLPIPGECHTFLITCCARYDGSGAAL